MKRIALAVLVCLPLIAQAEPSDNDAPIIEEAVVVQEPTLFDRLRGTGSSLLKYGNEKIIQPSKDKIVAGTKRIFDEDTINKALVEENKQLKIDIYILRNDISNLEAEKEARLVINPTPEDYLLEKVQEFCGALTDSYYAK